MDTLGTLWTVRVSSKVYGALKTVATESERLTIRRLTQDPDEHRDNAERLLSEATEKLRLALQELAETRA